MGFNDAAVVTVRRNYGIHFWGMNKSQALKRMKKWTTMIIKKYIYYSDIK